MVGNIGVFGTNMRMWTADTQTVAQRSAWVAQLDEMAALQPAATWPHARRHRAGRKQRDLHQGYLQRLRRMPLPPRPVPNSSTP